MTKSPNGPLRVGIGGLIRKVADRRAAELRKRHGKGR